MHIVDSNFSKATLSLRLAGPRLLSSIPALTSLTVYCMQVLPDGRLYHSHLELIGQEILKFEFACVSGHRERSSASL